MENVTDWSKVTEVPVFEPPEPPPTPPPRPPLEIQEESTIPETTQYPASFYRMMHSRESRSDASNNMKYEPLT